jgi:dipeptidyl aminopeptidase/acylaminoacyl peptidase
MTLVDLINSPQTSDPQLSPDGRQILFVESEANWKTDRRISHIWRINADGSGLIQMTSGADGENSPRWSPDGKAIAFLAKRGAEPEVVNQIYLISTSGGEARPLTNHATAVSNIQWSPDGAAMYFRAADPKSDELKAREKLKDDVFMFDVFMFDENYEQQHLWSVAIAGIADPDHMVKMGWSGGGHMTNKIITVTDRFKAASAGAGAADWVSMYAQSDVRTYRTPWFGGTPWQKDAPIDIYWDNSKGCLEGEDAGDISGWSKRRSRSGATVGRDVSCVEEQRRPHASLRSAARAAWMGRIAPRPVQDECGIGLV